MKLGIVSHNVDGMIMPDVLAKEVEARGLRGDRGELATERGDSRPGLGDLSPLGGAKSSVERADNS